MRGTMLYGPRDVRFEERPDPTILDPTDAIIRISAACVCGSDLWPYRGIAPITGPTPMGHEYCGMVEEVGSAVKHIKPGQFVVGSFFASDNTCPNCQFGYQSSCMHRQGVGGAQAPLLRVPLADGTLVATPGVPSADLIPSLLTASDVLGTGWFAADAANVKPGSTVVVVGDGAVGLLGVLSARQMGAERIIAISRNASRQKLARELHAQGGVRLLRRRPARGRAQRRGIVLRPHSPPRRSRHGASLPARADRPGVEREDQPRQSIRPGTAHGAGCRGLPLSGRDHLGLCSRWWLLRKRRRRKHFPRGKMSQAVMSSKVALLAFPAESTQSTIEGSFQ